MANQSMLEAFESSTRVPVDYSYAAFAFIAVGMIGFLLVVVIKDGWARHQNEEMSIGDFMMIIMRAMILFLFALAVFSPTS
ncbi:MAG: hypothetical protein CL693_02960 [Cellvibrionaceae bacterium]|nr:hypothetical protein [Cellvibrionaceae bacterium]|tara:strand:+ start:223 stop:465 length:243 start_codon:yes stop_codon:yes gene_type:complete